jgi:hypothetical protein
VIGHGIIATVEIAWDIFRSIIQPLVGNVQIFHTWNRMVMGLLAVFLCFFLCFFPNIVFTYTISVRVKNDNYLLSQCPWEKSWNHNLTEVDVLCESICKVYFTCKIPQMSKVWGFDTLSRWLICVLSMW